jgi:chromosome segregation ATPase
MSESNFDEPLEVPKADYDELEEECLSRGRLATVLRGEIEYLKEERNTLENRVFALQRRERVIKEENERKVEELVNEINRLKGLNIDLKAQVKKSAERVETLEEEFTILANHIKRISA